MHGLQDERRPSRCRQAIVATAVLAVVGIIFVGAHCCSSPPSTWSAIPINDEVRPDSKTGAQEELVPSKLLTEEVDVELDGDVDVISMDPGRENVAQVALEEDFETVVHGDGDDSDNGIQLQRRQDDGANATSPSSAVGGDVPSSADVGDAPSTSSLVDPPTETSTVVPAPDTTVTEQTTLTTEIVPPPDTPTTTTVPPAEETTSSEPPPPETTTVVTTEVLPTTSDPPTSDPPTTTLGTSISSEETSSPGSPTLLPPTSSAPTSTPSRSPADSSLEPSSPVILPTTTQGLATSTILTTEGTTSNTFVISETTEEQPSSTTQEAPSTTAEEPTTTETDDTTSSAVEETFTTTLPNGSKTVITSTTYVDVIASGEPTADATDADLQNIGSGLSSGPVFSLIVAFLATCYFMA